jgi:N-acetyl-anhydromuramyl-L-alanine amidase AmpD
MFETAAWEYIPAKFQQLGRKKTVRLVVIHSTESLEVEGGARQIAHYFQSPPRPGSSHVVVDDKEIIQCVHDSDTAAGAIGANQDGVHIEQIGTAAQTAALWADDYSKAVIANAANVTAQYCLKFDLPVKHLSNDELKAGAKGIVGHYQVSAVYPGSGHTDPGPAYPWDDFMVQVQANYDRLTNESASMKD